MAEDLSIFQEIDEALRADNVEKFLRRWGKVIIATCIGIIFATGFSVFWKSHQAKENMKYTSILLQAADLSSAAKYKEAEEKFAEVEKNGGRNIATIAGLVHAEMLAKLGEEQKAVELYNELAMKGSDEAMRNLALLNANVIASDYKLQVKTKDLNIGVDESFGAFANEVKALRLQNEGRYSEARALLQKIVDSERVPASERSRATELLAAVPGDKK